MFITGLNDNRLAEIDLRFKLSYRPNFTKISGVISDEVVHSFMYLGTNIGGLYQVNLVHGTPKLHDAHGINSYTGFTQLTRYHKYAQFTQVARYS